MKDLPVVDFACCSHSDQDWALQASILYVFVCHMFFVRVNDEERWEVCQSLCSICLSAPIDEADHEQKEDNIEDPDPFFILVNL